MANQDEQKKEKNPSEKVEKLVEEISTLSALELSNLVNALQEKFGITAAPASFALATPATQAQPTAETLAGTQQVVSESSTQTLIMTASGDNKIAVIKALREINPNLGLKEAKDATENLPYEVLKDAKADEVKEAAEKLKNAGATVEVK